MSFTAADGPVLITQSQLTRFAGSEMVVIELVDHLTARGIRVIVGEHLVTMSGKSGLFTVTLVNDLDHSVRVGVAAGSAPDLRITAPTVAVLKAGQRTTVRLKAHADATGVPAWHVGPTDGPVLTWVVTDPVRRFVEVELRPKPSDCTSSSVCESVGTFTVNVAVPFAVIVALAGLVVIPVPTGERLEMTPTL